MLRRKAKYPGSLRRRQRSAQRRSAARQLRRAHHRRRIRLAPRAPRLGLCRHEGRLDRRQSLRREGHRRRRAGHHHRLRANLRPSAGLISPACRCWRSSTAAARWPRLRRHSSAIPSAQLAATGITGTNGKTTTAFLTEALLNAAARKTVLVGTIEYHVAGECAPRPHHARVARSLRADGRGRGARRHRAGHRGLKPRARPGRACRN
jgi:hypothetical protein